jgi:hypothetical protein
MRLPARPTIYEINTAVWLSHLGVHTLAQVPARAWDGLAALPVDAVWLMGVWERSPAGLAIAQADPVLAESFRVALGEVRPGDVIGSPYCVRRYEVDERFGGRAGLAHARRELAARGLGLILDYVPNHVAPDHPWVQSNPEFFIRDEHGGIALGRDPYFPPWPDVVQLNAFHPGLRGAVADMLADVGAQCDGLRCDMAMLVTNAVFAKTWGLEPPADEFWPALIARVRWAHPDLVFIAEAYWDMEYALQQQGFDLCYDKRLYDRLAHEGAPAVRAHLQADLAYQSRLVRFVENHDEPRAAATFGERARAAAVVMATVPGGRLLHDGQLSGRRVHVPVFLARAPEEPPDAELRAFYQRLLPAVAELRGEWRLCETEHPSLLAWAWDAHLIAVNYGAERVAARVHVPWTGDVVLEDRLTGARFERGEELWVVLEPWGAHFFAWTSA